MKAISPIIATLLLIAIAVVASLVVYAWVMGYVGFQTNNAGNSVKSKVLTWPVTINIDISTKRWNQCSDSKRFRVR